MDRTAKKDEKTIDRGKTRTLDLFAPIATTIAKKILNGHGTPISDEELYIEIVYPALCMLEIELPPIYCQENANRILINIITNRIRIYTESVNKLIDINNSVRNKIRSLYGILAPLMPPASEYRKIGHPALNGIFLPQAIGVSKIPGRERLSLDVLITLKKTIGTTEGDNLCESAALRVVFDMLDWENPTSIRDNKKKLLACGIKISESIEIDLRETATNTFNVSLFKTPDGYISGNKILENSGSKSLEELFSKLLPKAIIVPAEKKDLGQQYTEGNPTHEELATTARSFDNMQRLLKNIYTDTPEGKWKIRATIRDFKKTWLKINGTKLKGGLKVIEIVTGGTMTQKDIEACLRLIFGPDNVEFVVGEKGNTLVTALHSREQILNECSSDTNIARFKEYGITVADRIIEIDYIMIDAINNVTLQIKGREVKLVNIMRNMHFDINREGLESFMASVFPGKKMISTRYDNGTLIEKGREATIEDLRKPENKAILLILCKKDENGLIVVDLNTTDLLYPFICIDGKTITYKSLATKLNLELNNDGIHELYCIVFGEENVAPRKTYRRKDSYGVYALSPAEVQSLLSLNENRERLLQFTELDPQSGKLRIKIGIKMHHFGTFQTLQGGKGIGMKTILNTMGLPVRRSSFIAVYRMIFGDKILEENYKEFTHNF